MSVSYIRLVDCHSLTCNLKCILLFKEVSQLGKEYPGKLFKQYVFLLPPDWGLIEDYLGTHWGLLLGYLGTYCYVTKSRCWRHVALMTGHYLKFSFCQQRMLILLWARAKLHLCTIALLEKWWKITICSSQMTHGNNDEYLGKNSVFSFIIHSSVQ